MKHRKSKNRLGPFVPVLKDMLDAPATKALSHGAFRLYVALKRECNPDIAERRNGRVYLSLRRAQEEMRSKRGQIARWYRELAHYGFIVMTEAGCLGLEGKGRAPRWRLTELGFMNDPPTKDFLRWNGVKFRDQEIQNPGPENGTAVVPKMGPPVVPKMGPPEAESGPENGTKGNGESGPENGTTTQSYHMGGRSREPVVPDARPSRDHRPPRGRRSTAKVVNLAMHRERS
jgi:hypothetical protein